jgi:hypothetical protein
MVRPEELSSSELLSLSGYDTASLNPVIQGPADMEN